MAEPQVAAVVRSWVLLSENVPRTVNCCVVVFAIEGLTGVTAIETSVAEVTVSVVEAVLPPNTAVIVEVPAVVAVASPCEPAALLMVTAAVSDELHVTVVVRFWVLPSEKTPRAVNC